MIFLTQRLRSRKFFSLLYLAGLLTGISLTGLSQSVQAATPSDSALSLYDSQVPDGVLLTQGIPDEASAYNEYQDLLQVLTCPEDAAAYGDYYNYGYWDGGTWCGQQGRAGYWVWSAPDWYVWGDVVPVHADAGKYTSLVQVLTCPEDVGTYGDYHDYGYWDGGTWCGERGMSGYWVWSYPNWYVWEVWGE